MLNKKTRFGLVGSKLAESNTVRGMLGKKAKTKALNLPTQVSAPDLKTPRTGFSINQ